MIKQKAKSNLRKYKIWEITSSIGLLVPYALCCFWGGPVTILCAMCLLLFFSRFIRTLLFIHFINKPIYNHLDAPLYHEIIWQGRIWGRNVLHLLDSEYFIGNYENVISICQRKLNAPKENRLLRYYYYGYLANVYFDTDNTIMLKATLGEYEHQLQSEKPKFQKRVKTIFEKMEFYKHYVDGNFAECHRLNDRPVKYKVHALRVFYWKARILLAETQIEEAQQTFETVLKNPKNINYTDLSQKALHAIEKNTPYCSEFETLHPNTAFEIPTPSTFVKVWGIIRYILLGLALALVLMNFLISIHLNMLNSLLPNEEQEQEQEQLNSAYIEYLEKIRVLVEQDYDNVKVLEAFNVEKDDETADAMFFCTIDNSLLLCSLYTYEDEDVWFYEIKYELYFSEIEFLTHSPVFVSLECTTSDYYVHSIFYINESDAPAQSVYATELEVDGQVICFAIMNVGTSPTYTVPNTPNHPSEAISSGEKSEPTIIA